MTWPQPYPGLRAFSRQLSMIVKIRMLMLGSAVLMNSSPVFHVSLLKPYHADAYSKPLPPEPEVEEGIPKYKVEKILSTRIRNIGRCKVQEFLIKWLGYDDAHNSWEPRKNLTSDLLADYPLK